MSSSQLVNQMAAQRKEWEHSADNRWVFLSCYHMMTKNMLRAIDAGEFEDGRWVNELLHHFAEYYFSGLEAYEGGSHDIPRIWEIAHQASRKAHIHPLQNLLLGINAHINYDLVLALVDLLKTDWPLSEVLQHQRYRDYLYVNKIIADTIDNVQDMVIEKQRPGMDIIDKLGGPVDEWVASQLINAWRGRVWEFAVKILDAENQREKAIVYEMVERDTVRLSERLLFMTKID